MMMNSKDNERAVEFARAFSSFVNAGKQDIPDAATLCVWDHPTLQQLMMRFCMTYITKMAEKTHGIDGRNEAGHYLAKELVQTEIWKRAYLPYI